MKLTWFTKGEHFETEGTPPAIGTRVYVRDKRNRRRVFLVDRVDRSIAVAPVGLDVIRAELADTPDNERFDKALQIAESMYSGVAKMGTDTVDVWMDRAEIHLKLDPEAFQDEGD